MESVVRAVGRIVVCVDAAAEVSTINSSSLTMTAPIPEVPKTEAPNELSTSPELAGLESPMPVEPMPA